jgi:hypothetical protein
LRGLGLRGLGLRGLGLRGLGLRGLGLRGLARLEPWRGLSGAAGADRIPCSLSGLGLLVLPSERLAGSVARAIGRL